MATLIQFKEVQLRIVFTPSVSDLSLGEVSRQHLSR